MSNVIKFPQKEEVDIELEITKDLVRTMITQLSEYGFQIVPDQELFNDISVIFNIFYAMLLRNAGEEHAWHPVMNELIDSLVYCQESEDE